MNGLLPDNPARGAERLIDLLRTLADPIRLRIIRLLEGRVQSAHAPAPSDGLSVGELADVLKLPQSTLSRHLKTLTDAGLAEARRDGTSMLYRLASAANIDASRQLRDLARAHLEHDPQAKTDAHRLAAVLRRREPAPAADGFFGKHAPEWDALRAKWFGDRFHLEALLALLDPRWVVADIGAGTGAMLPLLAPHVQQVIAIDNSPAMLRAAKARVKQLGLSNVDIRLGAAEGVPVDDHAVDVALLALVLVYTADPAAALREARRILKPGGTLLLIDLQPHTVEILREKLHHRWMGFEQTELTGWLLAAGYEHIRWHSLPTRHMPNTTPAPDLFALRATAG